MKFTLVILGAPYSDSASQSALAFAQAALDDGHSIHRLFFYANGVYNASRLAAPPQDEHDLPASWTQLIKQHQLDAVVCIAAALRRGVIDATEAKRYQKDSNNIAEGFELSGLGQLIEASAASDRLLTFGP
ncbi:sulfurtransferase complex subunit TusD [Gilvimarinus polysaccharolyticus]|uniref:sulfurtransferase complex subunit TusD n=1 Tax=Gilvimarinus polysaccharolyticus TaxID=863921 RepID=UPI000673A34F|nr:sulfurtransferase complex subunit TusD [Gilvimarinus polysaccharolyticus]